MIIGTSKVNCFFFQNHFSINTLEFLQFLKRSINRHFERTFVLSIHIRLKVNTQSIVRHHRKFSITIHHRSSSFVRPDISGPKVTRILSPSMKVFSIRVQAEIRRLFSDRISGHLKSFDLLFNRDIFNHKFFLLFQNKILRLFLFEMTRLYIDETDNSCESNSQRTKSTNTGNAFELDRYFYRFRTQSCQTSNRRHRSTICQFEYFPMKTQQTNTNPNEIEQRMPISKTSGAI